MRQIPNQVIRPATAVILASQPKTFPDPDLTPIKARREKAEQKMMDTKGRPFLAVFMKILGAFPAAARPSSSRLKQSWIVDNSLTYRAHANLCKDHLRPPTMQRSTNKH